MAPVSRRPNNKRNARKSVGSFPLESPDPKSHSWDNDEVQNLLIAILENGHMDFDAILKAVPNKTLGDYQLFLRTVRQESTNKKSPPDEFTNNLNNWIMTCENPNVNGGRTPLEIAMALKFLSLDGIVENHPLMEDDKDVDFGACYRLLYQAVLGHPLQPVNKATLDLVYQTLVDISESVYQHGNQSQVTAFTDVRNHFIKKMNNGLGKAEGPQETAVKAFSAAASQPAATAVEVELSQPLPVKPSVRCYERKRPRLVVGDKPEEIIQVYVIPVPGPSPIYTLQTSTDTKKNIRLEMPQTLQNNVIEEPAKNVLEMPSYNPLQMPVRWLISSSLIDKMSFTPKPVRKK